MKLRKILINYHKTETTDNWLKGIWAFCLFCLFPLSVSADDFMQGWTFWSDAHPEHNIVSIPHDAMQTEKRSADVEGGHNMGFFPGGKYHYEKIIQVSQKMLRQHVCIHFEGVWQKSKVSVNGQEVGGMVYGYNPFSVCLDGKLKKGKNVIRVDVDNSQTPNSRWYTGAGLYRPVHLVVQEQTHIEDVRIHTQSIAPAIVHVTVDHNGGEIQTNVLYEGKIVASAKGKDVEIQIPHAKLWSADHPNLYQVKVDLLQKGKIIETQTHDFGIRKISWSNKGLFVNGEQVLLRGGCLHHDNGILGACEYDEAAERKIRILKEYGFNAIRSAHNPCSDAILRACDKLGMYVMDELWDVWYDHKNPYDYASDFRSQYKEDMKAFVQQTYNHPSVIMYSIANEPTEPAKQEGVDLARDIVRQLHALDASRPVTAGINMAIIYMNTLGISLSGAAAKQGEKKMTSEQYNAMMANAGERLMKAVLNPKVDSVTSPVFAELDIAGYNYGNRRYEADATDHPDRIVVGTETYPYSLSENWEKVERLPYLVGDFMWTAWDYLGEAGIGAWYYSDEPPSSNKKYPWLLAGAGALDILGYPTGEALRAKAVWLKDNKPYIGVRPIHQEPLVKASWRGTNAIPSWSWKGCEGMKTQVEVFTSASKVRLYLNNRILGEEDVKQHVATFDVCYEPGTLTAVSIDANGNEQETSLVSAIGKIGIVAKTEKSVYHPNELIYVGIDLVGENGEIESKQDVKLNLQVEGAELLGFGSAQPRTEERFQTGSYTTYYGRSQAILRAKQPGKVMLTISGKGIQDTHKIIQIESGAH